MCFQHGHGRGGASSAWQRRRLFGKTDEIDVIFSFGSRCSRLAYYSSLLLEQRLRRSTLDTPTSPHTASFIVKARETFYIKMLSLNNKINFDYANPNSEASTDARKELAHLDYSPVKRITGRTFFMGMLVSMGGFIFG